MDIAIIILLVIGLCALSAVEIVSLHVQKQEFLHLQKELEIKEQEQLKREQAYLDREQKRLNQEQEKKRMENFVPYLVCVLEEEKVYDDNGVEVGELAPNTFHTVIFEKDGKGELFSGEGWINLENVIKNPVRNMQTPMKAVIRTPLKNGPGMGYKTLGDIMQNEIVEVIDIFGVWYKVKLSNDITGFVYYKNLR